MTNAFRKESPTPAPMIADGLRGALDQAPVRDTLVDSPPSRWQRMRAAASDFWSSIRERFEDRRLCDHLPPVPAPRPPQSARVPTGSLTDEERCERMLLEIMRAPPEYVRAAIIIGHATQNLRRLGNEVYADGFVHFALSRMSPDEDGTVPITRLRETLAHMGFARTLLPALLRLEKQGIVELVTDRDDAPISGVMDAIGSRVRLVVYP